MADNRQYVALEWVVKEIKETLLQAQRALELYARDADDVTQLQFCLTYIHQVYGSLHMAGFHGAAMIASEMEALTKAVVSNEVVARDEANEVLMRSILQLPDYLEQVKYSKRDQPSLVISLLNDLRAVRGASFLTESTLFSPSLEAARRIDGTPHPITSSNQQFITLISKLRKMYQYAAASIIRDVKVNESVLYLSKVSQRLCKTLVATKRFPLWEIVAAFVEGLENYSIVPKASTKTLLRQLDNELLVLEKHGVKALDDFTNDDLLKNLLYYLASAENATRSITAIKNKYGLDQLMPFSATVETDEGSSRPADSSAMRSVAKAIVEEFDDIKTHLDACEYDDSPENHLAAVEHALQRVADTLAILGVDSLRQQILQNVDLINDLREQSGPITHDQLLSAARNIAEVESELDSALLSEQGSGKSSSPYHFDAAQETVLQESRNGLEQAKDAIVNYIATQWDTDSLTLIPAALREVRGGLSMLSLDYVASIVSAANSYIETKLISEKITPEWQHLDSLADIIASIDYYLEVMSLTKDGDDSILESAERGLIELGVPVARVRDLKSQQADSFDGALGIDNVLPLVEEVSTEEVALEPSVDSVLVEDVEAEADDDAIDPEILEIFIEEADEVQQTIAEFFPLWANNFEDEASLIEFRRAFHTMKGSGRMVQANDIGELAWSIENMLNRVLDKTIAPSSLHVALIERVVSQFPEMLSAFEHQQATPNMEQVQQSMAWGEELSNDQPSDALIAALSSSEPAVADEQTDSEEETTAVDGEDFDAQLWEIFRVEAETHLVVVKEYIVAMDAARPLYEPPSDVMQRAIHTLKGSAHMAEMVPIAEMVTPMELFAKDLRSYQVDIDDDILQLIKDCVEYTEVALEQIDKHIYPSIPRLDQFIARVAELRERSVGHLIKLEEENKAPDVDPALLELLMTEGMNLLLNIDPLMRQWRETAAQASDWQPIADELAILTHGAERANLASMAELSSVLAARYNELINGYYQPSNEFYDLLLDGHDGLLDIIDAVAAGQDLPARDEVLLQRLEVSPQQQAALVEEIDATVVETVDESVVDDSVIDEPVIETTVTEVVDAEIVDTHIVDVDTTDVITGTTDVIEEDDDGIDDEIVEIFIEEATELLDELDETTHSWESGSIDDREGNDNLQRLLHTFKGGARLAGLMDLGELAHDYETRLIQSTQGEMSADIFEEIHQYQDQLHKYVDAVRSSTDLSNLPDVDSLSTDSSHQADNEPEDAAANDTADVDNSSIETIEDVVAEDDPHTQEPELEIVQPEIVQPEIVQPKPGDESPATILPFVPKAPEPSTSPIVPAADSGSSSTNATATTARRASPQEVVKVSADLMEELVNLAGETSISRGRMEEQISELGYSLEEMGSTVERLQEQLRRLDIETEAQVLFRQEQIADLEDFDPLEMDRYSQLQQLSRSLIESASDLMDLKATLSDKTRDAETVLLQQSRINTELQEGLMRSRMVPFSRIVPRLRRIVRQISTELNKEVNFEFGNTEGELDRSMMERMVAPLEHMLRNAVDHGIEDVAVREQQSKSAAGRIVLTLGREGSDVLIHLADDGAGINIERVREKAIERNLMNADAQLSDQEILQFILHAGFSTADKVTQISGRGVGMDVVHSEIKQLGGSVSIESRQGEGTAFTVRLPFTVSVNRALMINMGDDGYAIPLNTIEGIVRISPFELEHYYSNPDSRFEYAGEQYQLQYLGTLLDKNVKPRLDGHLLPVPVLLVRSADHSVALQVDSLQGSSEIVVKSLGAQFSNVQGLSGATILGDGHVVVILDLHAMIRQTYALSYDSMYANLHDQAPDIIAPQNPLIMVVDDSVTVRKVTTRLLEREGYEVITAKDGVDALAVLQDHMPVVMLLDIEMPRMDGFEVAKNVRSSSRLNHLPIIMITSRTGEKHKQRGFELGVNYYMGKPYQEDELLKNIRSLIAAEQSLDG